MNEWLRLSFNGPGEQQTQFECSEELYMLIYKTLLV